MVKTSRRPSSMAKAQTYLAKSEKVEKFPAGPSIFPTPGPELVMQPTMPLKGVVKSTPVTATSIVNRIVLNEKAETNTNTEDIML